MKNKEWLKEKADRLFFDNSMSNNPYLVAKREAITEISNLIDQLDEPEVLSQEWIDKNKFEVNGWNEAVHVEDLQNLLVPKQDKPVIPQFVADWMKDNHGYNIYGALSAVDKERHSQVRDWVFVKGGINDFTRAWLDGFIIANVEEEQKYILSINITDKASKTNYETFLNKRGIFHSMENESFNSEEFNWTEEEIKCLENGEILFEHFATKIEEL